MGNPATFASFETELNRLVAAFEKGVGEFKGGAYSEAKLRDDFLNPFFRALGWDLENKAGLIQQEREVEVESRTEIQGRNKRADYLFRADKRDRFVCEAKKPAEELHARYAFQAKRYAWNKDLPLAILTDFEELKIYVVGGKPHLDEPLVGLWKQPYHYKQYPLVARELWDLFSRDAVATGSIDKLIEALPKKPTGKGRARQQWLIKPDRSRALDTDFLEFLEEARRELAQDLLKHNDRAELLADNQLNEAVQRILDRILFLRICEDRDINTGELLFSIVEKWRKNTGKEDGQRAHQQPLIVKDEPAHYGAAGIRAPNDSLWRVVVRHFRALDRRPPSHVPFFNGNLFKPHFSEELIVGDDWLAGFISDLSDDECPYLFNQIPVEILGSVYERFLGNVLRPRGNGVQLEPKPEVRKAGGVYYTPRYIVNYIVEHTVGKLLDEIAVVGRAVPSAPPVETNPTDGAVEPPRPTLKDFERRTHALRVLDPACGSGSFLIRAFERTCEHWQRRLTADLPGKEQKEDRAAWEKKHRQLCWVDADTGDVHLTVALKRQILTQNIYGVDLDSGAVEVTQLSLYLKMLENENRTTLARERELFADAVALLPPLQDNIKCGNSLIASDLLDGELPTDETIKKLHEVHAFDWTVGFPAIMKAGGFDAIIGNPPYVRPHNLSDDDKEYFWKHFQTFTHKSDLYCCFIEQSTRLLKEDGLFSYIVSRGWLRLNSFQELRRLFLDNYRIRQLVDLPDNVFEDAQVSTCIFVVEKNHREKKPDTGISIIEGDLTKTGPKFTVIRKIPQSAFLTTFQNVFDLSISPETERIKEKMRRGPTIGSLYRVCFGLKTGDDSKFLHHLKGLHPDDERLLRGEDVKRYDYEWKGEYVWYVPSRMRAHRQTARPGEPARFEQPKLLVKDTTTDFAGTYDAKDYYVKDVLIVIPEDPEKSVFDLRYVTGIVNSPALKFYYRSTFKTIHVQCEELAGLPLPPIDLRQPKDKSRHDKLVALVDKMLVLTPKLRAAQTEKERETLQNAVTATDRQIDQLVYELYELTPEEIALIESASA